MDDALRVRFGRPSAISRASWTARSGLSTPSRISRSSVLPSTSSITIQSPCVGLDDVVDVDDRRMVEPRRHPRLAPEAQRADGSTNVGQEPLDRERPLQRLVEGAVDRTHAARAEALVDAVIADALGQAGPIV